VNRTHAKQCEQLCREVVESNQEATRLQKKLAEVSRGGYSIDRSILTITEPSSARRPSAKKRRARRRGLYLTFLVLSFAAYVAYKLDFELSNAVFSLDTLKRLYASHRQSNAKFDRQSPTNSKAFTEILDRQAVTEFSAFKEISSTDILASEVSTLVVGSTTEESTIVIGSCSTTEESAVAVVSSDSVNVFPVKTGEVAENESEQAESSHETTKQAPTKSQVKPNPVRALGKFFKKIFSEILFHTTGVKVLK
jgi:hypothetical protein